MVNSLDRKLLRDLSHLKGQIITVALVVAAGLSGLVAIYSTLSSIDREMQAYYERNRFADVFASATRVPQGVAERIETIDGVQTLQTRVVESARVPMEGLVEPARARVVSLPAAGQPALNMVHLSAGRLLEPHAPDEALVLDAFAEAHDLHPGDTLQVVMGGRYRTLRIVGIAMSPEYVFFREAGGFTGDERRSAVLWLNRSALEAAFQMEAAFNDVVVSLQPHASEAQVIAELDRLLEPYGGLGAVAREDQASHRVVTQEREQLSAMGTVIPVAFLAVAAFLLNVVLTRLVQLQRSEIATLKAVGYRDRQIGAHFFKFVMVILALGAAIGIAFGSFVGDYMTGQYAQFFRFPNFGFRLDWQLVAVGLLVTLVAGLGGAMSTVRTVIKLPPAEAMRPPAPEVYRATVLERLGLSALLSATWRLVLRELERRPWRFILSTIGLSLAVSLLVFGRFGWDAASRLIELQFTLGQREDVAVTLVGPVSARAEREMAELPGVLEVEGHRMVPVRFSSDYRYRDSILMGMPADNRMRRAVDEDGGVIEPPTTGVVLSRILGERLDVGPGDTITVEVREGDRQHLEVRVEGLVDDVFGLFGYMQLEHLHQRLGEEPAVSSVYLRVDRRQLDEVFRRLDQMPAVLSAEQTSRILEDFQRQLDESVSFQTLIIVIIASVIVIGVVYNNARIALSMRGRELASLRVLGFTRREVAFILLAEQAIQVLLAIPIGWVLGSWFARLLVSSINPENFRFPLYISPTTYAFTALVTLVAAVFSAMLIKGRLDRTDLTEALKSRE
jgi:putative ABC transport system permease protein